MKNQSLFNVAGAAALVAFSYNVYAQEQPNSGLDSTLEDVTAIVKDVVDIPGEVLNDVLNVGDISSAIDIGNIADLDKLDIDANDNASDTDVNPDLNADLAPAP